MSTTHKVYSPEKVVVKFATDLTLSGFAEGSSIQASRNSDNSSQVVGMQGDVGLTANADKTGTITFMLMQNSESNIILSAIQNSQDLSQTLLRGGLTIDDPSGGFLCHAQGCHIMTPAEMSLGDTQESKTWVFYAERLDFVQAGDLTQDAALLSRAAGFVETLKNASRLA